MGSKTFTPYAIQFVGLDDRTSLSFESLDQPANTVQCGVLIDNVQIVDITPASVHSFVGTWSTQWGDLTFVQNGRYLTGQYPHDNGRIVGYVKPDGKTFVGDWSETPSYEPPKDGGRVSFTLSDDGKTIKGQWGYGYGPTSSDWNGTRQ
jgi:hypothetical protein